MDWFPQRSGYLWLARPCARSSSSPRPLSPHSYSAAPPPPRAPARAGATSTTPGAAWDDTAGSPLQLHGLGIIKVGSTWYAYGEDKAGETSAGTPPFQAIPCYSSTDLQELDLRRTTQ